MDFPVPAGHRVKLKEWENKNKYLDFARELKNLWNIKVTIILIVIGALGTVTKGLVEGLENLEERGRVVTITIIAILRSAKILIWILETSVDLLSLKFQWETIGWG